MMKKVLVTGSEGFIGGYIVKELIDKNYYVIGIDNLSKYGQIIRNHSDSEFYEFHHGDVKDKNLLTTSIHDIKFSGLCWDSNSEGLYYSKFLKTNGVDKSLKMVAMYLSTIV